MSDPFNCKNCNESLGGRKYIQVEDKPHCIPCYDRLHANTCRECKEIIGHNDKVSATPNQTDSRGAECENTYVIRNTVQKHRKNSHNML